MQRAKLEYTMTDILFSIPENPLPNVHAAGFFETFDGLKLRYALFNSPVQPARGTVVIAQGRNESIEKYAETIRDLTAAGLWVATFDWRGQGGSPRLLSDARLGHVRHFADYERDFDAFMQEVVLPDAKLPFFLLAHSMGGLVALSAAPRLANRIERMVISAPFLDLAPASGRPPRVVRLVARLACLFGLGNRPSTRDRDQSEFERNVLTSDPVRFARNKALLAAFPQLALGPPTWRWLHECLKAGRRVATSVHLQRIAIPTLVLAPGEDRVASYPEMENLSRYFRAGHVVPIDGAQHELFQERDRYRAQAIAALTAFLPGVQAEPMHFDNDQVTGEESEGL